MDLTHIRDDLMGTVTGERLCDYEPCGKPFQVIWRGSKRRWCSVNCRVAAFRKLRREASR